MFRIFRKKKRVAHSIYPDEIFLDARNLPEFNTHQFEGRMEFPISSKTTVFLGVIFAAVALLFVSQLWKLEVQNGARYRALSETNRLRDTFIFPERGIIRDNQGTNLAWNILVPNTEQTISGSGGEERPISTRAYAEIPGLSLIIGYIGYPLKDNTGNYYQKETTGKAGIEEYYNESLRGENGVAITETNALRQVVSESVIQPPHDGKTLALTIDSRVQTKLYSLMESLAAERGFQGGAGVLLSVTDGSVLALTSFPEYSSSILTEGNNHKTINQYRVNPQKPFLNRAISGLYAPGSIIKPLIAVGALNENIISPEKMIISTGSISIPNPYDTTKKSVFADWKAHGAVDMRRALAVSSDVYFYEIGGGFENQKGLGIEKIEQYAKLFGLGEPTGIDLSGEESGTIPSPAWKKEVFGNDPWRIGDTYHTVIGQYGVQVTPLQMARAIAAIANGGMLVTPHVLENMPPSAQSIQSKVPGNILQIVREGMKEAVLIGTAKGLNVPEVSIAAKTGTAELGTTKQSVNSWVVGFFPYDKPRYVFAVVMEKGKAENTTGALYVMRELFLWMAQNTPEYLK